MAAFPSLSGVRDRLVKQYSNYLAQKGKELIEQAYYTRDFNNRTYNLHDSYGSCVFYSGKEVPGTRRYIGKVATKRKVNRDGEPVLGREEIDSYFDSYKTTYKGFELVTAVAMFYGEILEKGFGHLKRKYKVISGMDSELQALAKELNARIVNINV